MLATGAEIKHYGVGETIPKDPRTHLYRIKKGSVKVEQVIGGQTTVFPIKREGDRTVWRDGSFHKS